MVVLTSGEIISTRHGQAAPIFGNLPTVRAGIGTCDAGTGSITGVVFILCLHGNYQHI